MQLEQGRQTTWIRILAVCFVGLNVLDAFLTKAAIDGRLGTELNPIMRLFVTQPLYKFVGIKVGLAVGIAAILILAAKDFPGPVKRILIALVICMIGICLFNGIPLALA